MTKLRPREKKILSALSNLGAEASTREIAIAANLNVNGVSQTLGRLIYKGRVQGVGGGRGGDFRWRLCAPSPN